ncbi:PQQ-dependent sugar dehydrogenase [Agriterribacter sp.]|uniref:PQQ-dependent sugar dehydrogenase n=1 Tax=Agriterribacter sp. TaxID=2821509 RepID=UPI002B66ED27|nr:PQQ-dependent sugar dehydrogenase [Agriterribacter sp.]HTN08340.1 PQQ-dependent sugar dehydrogenase [Agriterribacter sp.]
MPKRLLPIHTAMILLLLFCSCHPGSSSHADAIPSDSTVIASGKTLFNQYCASCHNMQQNGIGPKLAGITTEVPAEWLRHFILSPEQTIASGDERATRLFKEYKTMMPSFATLKDNDVNALIAFLNAHQPSANSRKETNKGLADPIPERIKFSGLVVNLTAVTSFPVTADDGKKPLARITKLDFQPNTGDLFVDDLNGKLYKIKNGQPVLYMDIIKLKPRFIHQPGLATGLGSFAFHPNFAANGLFYTTHTEPPYTAKAIFGFDDSIKATVQWVLTEWKVSNTTTDHFAGTSRELFRADMVGGIHGVQEITFNPLAKPGDEDYGLLYIGVGDGGSVENGYSFLAQSKEKIWGTILRIDPLGRNSANGQYGIPAHNPFAREHTGKIPGEIYAFGFRNPHRISWTRDGKMLACNIGQHHIESVNLVRPGNNYGWPTREGSFVIDPHGDINNVYPLPANDSVYKITYPVAEFDHDEGVAISGGLEYWGDAIPQLKGKYFFGDIPSGRLYYINVSDIEQGKQAMIREWSITIGSASATLAQACESSRVDLHFGRDAQGELYILTKADGKLYKLTSAEQTQE